MNGPLVELRATDVLYVPREPTYVVPGEPTYVPGVTSPRPPLATLHVSESSRIMGSRRLQAGVRISYGGERDRRDGHGGVRCGGGDVRGSATRVSGAASRQAGGAGGEAAGGGAGRGRGR